MLETENSIAEGVPSPIQYPVSSILPPFLNPVSSLQYPASLRQSSFQSPVSKIFSYDRVFFLKIPDKQIKT
jgi:hypothetical protein